MSHDHPAPAPEPAKPGSDNTFFDWMRGLNVPRQPGWIGGVCAGIAARLGIDPIIVRGIAVVIAILGGPALLLYAAAWLLLPDQYNRIHLQDAIRGNFTQAHAGIGVMFLLSFLPFAQWLAWGPITLFGRGTVFPGFTFDSPIWGLLWTVAILCSIIWLVIWLVNRSKGETPGAVAAPPTAATATNAAASASDATATTTVMPDLPPAPEAPPHPDSGATDADLAAWKEQQAAWKREYDSWKQQQAAGERELAQQRAAEQRRIRQEQSAERHRAAIEEQRRTRSNPVYSLVAIGLAIIAGAATALTIGDTGDATAAITGMAVSLGVLGLAIIVNGFRGKRSGGSGGVAFLLVVALSITSVFTWVNGPIAGRNFDWSPSYSTSQQESRRVVVTGNVTVDLSKYFLDPPATDHYENGLVRLYVGRGDVRVILPAEEHSAIEVQTFNGSISFADMRRATTFGITNAHEQLAPRGGGERLRDVYVRVWVASGDVTITQALD
jgi:phage shock protein PspC (stress-responsive transcriptional regulator)